MRKQLEFLLRQIKEMKEIHNYEQDKRIIYFLDFVIGCIEKILKGKKI